MSDDGARPTDSPALPARATVVIDGATVTIMPRRAPVGNSGPIRGRSLAIFPGAASSADARSDVKVHPATFEPGARPAHAITDLSEAYARARGVALALNWLLYWDGRRAQVLDCRELNL